MIMIMISKLRRQEEQIQVELNETYHAISSTYLAFQLELNVTEKYNNTNFDQLSVDRL